MGGTGNNAPERAAIVPLGDSALLVRFAETLDDRANQLALSLTERLCAEPISGVVEVVPSLVSVLVRYDPRQTGQQRLAGELGLLLDGAQQTHTGTLHDIAVWFDGPDLDEVAQLLALDVTVFVERHNRTPLRVLTTGFAPGFVYCGFHDEELTLPRRMTVRPSVPAGSVLFAAGQTAITATEVPTGWHVIGRTGFRNFDPQMEPPTRLLAGDRIRFVVAG